MAHAAPDCASGTARRSRSAQEGLPLTLYRKESNGPLLAMAKTVVHERELSRNIAEQLEAHAAAGRDAPGLDTPHGTRRGSTEVDRVELVADDVKVAGVCGPGVHDPEA